MTCRGHCAQGRTQCPHPTQCQHGRVEQALTDWGLLDDGTHSEPDTLDLPPMTRTERGVLWFAAVVAIAATAYLIAALG